MLLSILFSALMYGDTIKSSSTNMNLLQLYTRGYCVSYEPPLTDTTLTYVVKPETEKIALYFGYSSPSCVTGITIDNIILSDTMGNTIGTGLYYNLLTISYPYRLNIRLRSNGGCVGVDNLCPYYININPLAVKLCGYEIKFDNVVRCSFDICTSSATKQFIVDRSSDLNTWTRVTVIPAENYSSNLLTYSFYDAKYISGVSYYRVFEEDLNGNLEIVLIDYVVAPHTEEQMEYDLSGRLIGFK